MAFRMSPISRLALCAGLAACFPRQAAAQPSFGDSAEILIVEAHLAFSEHTPESLERSIRLFQEALALLNEPRHVTRRGVVLMNIGTGHHARGRPDSAFSYLHRALEVSREVSDTTSEGHALYNLGVVHAGVGSTDTALAYFHASLKIERGLGDRPGEAAVLAAIGNAYLGVANGDSAGAYLTQALPIARDVKDSSLIATTLEFIGAMHQMNGRADSADVYLAGALEIRRALGDPVGAIGVRIIQSVPPTAEHGDSGLARLHAMLDSARMLSDHNGEGVMLDRIGFAHQHAGRLDSALLYHGQALALQRRLGYQRRQGATLAHIARAHAASGRADSALAYYRWALQTLRIIGDGREVGSVLANIGVLYHVAGTPAALAKAVAYYDSADAVLKEVGRFAGDDYVQLSVAEMNVPLYESWALAWTLRERRVGRHRSAYAALAASERGRAQGLRDLMRRRATPAPEQQAGAEHTGPGADMAAEGRDLATALSIRGIPALSYLVTDGTLLAFLVSPDGRVEVFRTVVTHDSLAGLVEEVRDGLNVDSADSRLRAAPRTARAEPGTASDPAAASEDPLAWVHPATLLSEILFPAALRERLPASGELVIVPSGPLFLLPFAVLPVPSRQSSETLLGLRYALRYAPSLQVIAELEKLPGAWYPAVDALVVGNPEMPLVSPRQDSLFLAELDSAGLEGGWVADRLGTRMLTGRHASEAAVRAQLAGASLVHLATHALAYANIGRARESFIALAPGDGEDGLLTVGEVMDELPDMQAELVVLSACQTGLGGLSQAEGTVGLQRAFLARGVRGMLVSQWSVDDGATALLMQEFYANWMGGLSRAEALRRAQLTVASSRPNPRFWAAFQMVGVH